MSTSSACRLHELFRDVSSLLARPCYGCAGAEVGVGGSRRRRVCVRWQTAQAVGRSFRIEKYLHCRPVAAASSAPVRCGGGSLLACSGRPALLEPPTLVSDSDAALIPKHGPSTTIRGFSGPTPGSFQQGVHLSRPAPRPAVVHDQAAARRGHDVLAVCERSLVDMLVRAPPCGRCSRRRLPASASRTRTGRGDPVDPIHQCILGESIVAPAGSQGALRQFQRTGWTSDDRVSPSREDQRSPLPRRRGSDAAERNRSLILPAADQTAAHRESGWCRLKRSVRPL